MRTREGIATGKKKSPQVSANSPIAAKARRTFIPSRRNSLDEVRNVMYRNETVRGNVQ
jgi:hypothetical protein